MNEKSRLIEILQEIDKEVDGMVTQNDLDNFDCPSSYTFRKEFGSWSEAKQQAGIQTNKYSNRELIERLRKASKEVDGKLTRKDIVMDWGPSPQTYEKRFGSLRKAKKKAGINVKTICK
jgi:hypothetical protein